MTGGPEEETPEQRAASQTALATRLFGEGKIEEAIQAFRAAVEIWPDYAEGFSNLGASLRRSGDDQGALAAFSRALEIDPCLASAHFNMANALVARGQVEPALAAYRAAIRYKPDYAGAYNNLANLLGGLERFDEALPAAREAARLAPGAADVQVNLGNVLLGLNRPGDAVPVYETAIRLNGNFVLAHANLGMALKNSDRLEEAVASHRRAVELAPGDASSHVGLGVALRESGRAGDAVRAYRKAVELNPGHGPAHVNLGIALIDQNDVGSALEVLLRAVEMGAEPGSFLGPPDHATAQKNLGLSMLMRGDLADGARFYEWRWKTREFKPRGFGQPLWDGAGFVGKTLLLHAEQGLGDVIQFARYGAPASRLGGRVVVECQPELFRLLQGLEGIDQLVRKGDELPPFDLHAPVFSLLHLMETGLESVPGPSPYLRAEEDDLKAWRERLGNPGSRPRVGLVWAGSPVHRNDRNRSMPLSLLAPLLEGAQADFYSLQVGPAAAQLAELDSPGRITDLTSFVSDFADTAAFVECLDLVITVDTAVAHLAGGLGKPVWVLLPFAPDWRWMLERNDSPWYPSMRLFRQPGSGDWAPVIERVLKNLMDF